MTPATYAHLLRHARRVSRRADEAEDLVQTVVLAALHAGRVDLDGAETQRWLRGALRKRAAFEARTALRRRLRETTPRPTGHEAGSALPAAFLAGLSPALQRTAALALGGHTRAEIAWLLRISDATLRQRLTQIRRRWHAAGHGPLDGMPGLAGPLPYGLIRQALQPAVGRAAAQLGSHDPDGHIFVLSSAHKTPLHGNKGYGTSEKEI